MEKYYFNIFNSYICNPFYKYIVAKDFEHYAISLLYPQIPVTMEDGSNE